MDWDNETGVTLEGCCPSPWEPQSLPFLESPTDSLQNANLALKCFQSIREDRLKRLLFLNIGHSPTLDVPSLADLRQREA